MIWRKLSCEEFSWGVGWGGGGGGGIAVIYHSQLILQLWHPQRLLDTVRSCIDSSYMLSREYRVVRNRYSRWLFTSEDRLCANLRAQEQSTNMMSQCQYLTFA